MINTDTSVDMDDNLSGSIDSVKIEGSNQENIPPRLWNKYCDIVERGRSWWFCKTRQPLFDYAFAFTIGLLFSPWSKGFFFILIFAALYTMILAIGTNCCPKYWHPDERIGTIASGLLGWLVGRILIGDAYPLKEFRHRQSKNYRDSIEDDWKRKADWYQQHRRNKYERGDWWYKVFRPPGDYMEY